MFRLFRKDRQRIISRSNLGRYLLYALGEVALIVGGILLAIQVDGWNQERKDRDEEQLILTRLKNELDSNSNKLSTLLNGLDTKTQALERVSASLKTGQVGNDSVFLADVITSSLWGWTVQPLQRLIYEEVNNTGKLALIQNIELRDQITELYNTIEVTEGTALARNSDFVRVVYAIIPRESETRLKRDLTPYEHRILAGNVLNSSLDQLIIFEENRTSYLNQIWKRMVSSINRVNHSIESELNHL